MPTIQYTTRTCYWSEAEAVRRDAHCVEIATIQCCVENVEQQETIVVADRTQVQSGDYRARPV